MKKLATIFAIVLFSLPAVGLAQINNGLGIGPRLGYYEAEDADEGNIFGGLQLRGRFSEYFGIEAAVEYNPKQELGVEGVQTVEVSSVPLTASALLFLPVSEKFVPYGLAGLGAYYNIYDSEGLDDDLDSTFNIGYQLGFGLQIPFNSNVALNADYRYRFLNPDTNEESLDDTDFSGNAFRLGLVFYL